MPLIRAATAPPATPMVGLPFIEVEMEYPPMAAPMVESVHPAALNWKVWNNVDNAEDSKKNTRLVSFRCYSPDLGEAAHDGHPRAGEEAGGGGRRCLDPSGPAGQLQLYVSDPAEITMLV